MISTTDDVRTGARPVSRVLVVDDDPVTGGMVQFRIEDLGYSQVEQATSGEEALDQLGKLKPDLVLLDVSMPGISGMQVLERIRQWQMDTAVIMMTAYGSEETVVDAMRRGADDFLRKPFEPEEFKTVLERNVARLELERQNESLKHHLRNEKARAADVQAALLPKETPEIEGFDLAARLLPSEEVGGNFYGWTEAESGSLNLTLGDAVGTGVSASLLAATARATMRAVSLQNPPGQAMRLASLLLEQDVRDSGGSVALFHARLDPGEGRLLYVDAGHGNVFVQRAGGEIEGLSTTAAPLGTAPGESYAADSVVFEPGDALVAYSEGFFDAHPGELDLREISAALNGASSAGEMADLMLEASRLVELPSDDLTVLVLYRRP